MVKSKPQIAAPTGSIHKEAIRISAEILEQSEGKRNEACKWRRALDSQLHRLPDGWVRVLEEEVVISGFSGRFPQAESVAELAEALYSGSDLVTEDHLRWDPGTYGLQRRHGKLKQLEPFDAAFFGIPAQASRADGSTAATPPHHRLRGHLRRWPQSHRPSRVQNRRLHRQQLQRIFLRSLSTLFPRI